MTPKQSPKQSQMALFAFNSSRDLFSLKILEELLAINTIALCSYMGICSFWTESCSNKMH